MARGWESKSIEAQQDEASRAPSRGGGGRDVDPERAARMGALRLARARADADLAVATRPAHRRMLEAALAALDEQIRALDEAGAGAVTE